MAKYIAVIVDWEAFPEYQLRAMCTHTPESAKGLTEEAQERQAFTAYLIEASTPDEVFQTLNISHPSDYRLRSMSVGDWVIRSDGDSQFCAGNGWYRF